MESTIHTLLHKYKQGKASKKELFQLLQLLDADTFETWMEDEFESDIVTNISENSSWDGKSNVFDKIISQINTTETHPSKLYWISPIWMRAIAAASIVILLSIWSIFQFSKENSSKNIDAYTASQLPIIPIKTYHNLTDKKESILLSDGSKVTLYPNSEIVCIQPFIGTKRSIRLLGKAKFKVAKDKSKPFTVYTGAISTTALGTEFIVDNKKSISICIQLLEGKIWLRKESQQLKGWHKDQILTPGQLVNYDYKNGSYTYISGPNKSVSHLHSNISSQSVNNTIISQTIPSVSITKNEITFRQVTLSEVFKTLSTFYSYKITIVNADINGKVFSGKILQSDSLPAVINGICILNNLKCVFQENEIEIQNNINDSIQVQTLSLDTMTIQ